MKHNSNGISRKKITTFFFLTLLLIPFQNCSQFSRQNLTSPVGSSMPLSTPDPVPSPGSGMPSFLGMMPVVDVSKIPTGDPGTNKLLVFNVDPVNLDLALKDINSPKFNLNAFRNWNPIHHYFNDRAELLYYDAQGQQTTVDTGKPVLNGGDARTSCKFAQMRFDDPIVFPGQPGRSHLHAFFGNTGVNAYSTSKTLVESGNSTCFGGIGNRSSYWVPAMIDTRTGTPIKPENAGFYYKHGTISGKLIKVIPDGLRMIAGDASNTDPQGNPHHRFACLGGPNNENSKYGPGIGLCDKGSELWMSVFFPQCWDGINLDSPNHKSHMSYPVYSGVGDIYDCPATHPVAIPHIVFNIIYKTTSTDDISKWRLSSDNYSSSLPGGYSGHGDYMFGWQKDVIAGIVKCSNIEGDCHSQLLGGEKFMDGY